MKKQEITSKKCSRCNNFKTLSEYGNDIRCNDGLKSDCRKCNAEKSHLYRKTKKGLVTEIYASQRQSSNKRNDPMPTYIKQELTDWLYSQTKFHELYDNWKASGFERWSTPSCDRKDDYKGYSLNNLQLMTWRENNNKSFEDRKNGINNKTNKAIIGIHIETGKELEFHSQGEAERATGIGQRNISSCCLKKPMHKSAGGYVWKFKN